MKALDTATIVHLIKVVTPLTLIAYSAVLLIRIIMTYILTCPCSFYLEIAHQFSCTIPKRILSNRVVHDRKHALYPGSTEWKFTGLIFIC